MISNTSVDSSLRGCSSVGTAVSVVSAFLPPSWSPVLDSISGLFTMCNAVVGLVHGELNQITGVPISVDSFSNKTNTPFLIIANTLNAVKGVSLLAIGGSNATSDIKPLVSQITFMSASAMFFESVRAIVNIRIMMNHINSSLSLRDVVYLETTDEAAIDNVSIDIVDELANITSDKLHNRLIKLKILLLIACIKMFIALIDMGNAGLNMLPVFPVREWLIRVLVYIKMCLDVLYARLSSCVVQKDDLGSQRIGAANLVSGLIGDNISSALVLSQK